MKHLPLQNISETTKILKKTISANRSLAELKGIVKTIPNQNIIINTLSLQESKDSSEIEQIRTTHDEIFKSFNDSSLSAEAKEVQNYANALKFGTEEIKKNNFITSNMLIEINKIVKSNNAGFRKTLGTKLLNGNGEVVYTPPQDPKEIIDLMSNLEKYINENDLDSFDPLVKMAIIHNQFESIHPFYDGNGRVGRILNILYLILNDLLDIPVLYLSKYIIQNKNEYYRLFQEVKDNNNWEDWILFMLEAIEETSKETILKINEIRNLMIKQKHIIRDNTSKIYSQELLNILFSHPYTRPTYLIESLNVSRATAGRYLSQLADLKVLELRKIGRNFYYINTELFEILSK